jgi:hypothetical protein
MSTKACLLQEIDWFLLEVLFALIPEHLRVPGEACAEGSQELGLSTLDGIVADRHVANSLVLRLFTVVRLWPIAVVRDFRKADARAAGIGNSSRCNYRIGQ